MPRRNSVPYPIMNVREFRNAFSSLKHPVIVVKARSPVQVLGVYYPEEEVTDSTGVRYASSEPNTRGPERSGGDAS
jgi:hypothetical protein